MAQGGIERSNKMTKQHLKNITISVGDLSKALKQSIDIYAQISSAEEPNEIILEKLKNNIIALNEILKAKGIDILN